MRTPLVAASVCVIAGLALSGTASARSELPAVLTENRIYQSGTASRITCAIPGIRGGSTASVRRFHQALAKCANRFWAARFRAADLRYIPPKLTITTGDRSVCGEITHDRARYCPVQRAIVIRIQKLDLRNPSAMTISHSVAHEWGHHVQELSGIYQERERLHARSGRKARATLGRRLETQAECFAGVFYSATLDSIAPGVGWSEWLEVVEGAKRTATHGEPHSRAYWQDRGFTGGSAGHCNTWTAPNFRVA